MTASVRKKWLVMAVSLHVWLPIYLGLLTYQLRSAKPELFNLIDPVVPRIIFLNNFQGELGYFIKWNFADMAWGWAMSASLLLIERKPALQDAGWLIGYAVALCIEFGQIFGVPGTFDVRDLVALSAGYFFPVIFFKGKSV